SQVERGARAIAARASSGPAGYRRCRLERPRAVTLIIFTRRSSPDQQPHRSLTADTAELYDPSTVTFTATTQTSVDARINPTATLLPHGKVMIAYGGAP